MKNFFSLIFMLTLVCVCNMQAQAQGVYVTGQVTDSNGDPVGNAIGLVQYDDCGTVYIDTVFTDPNGYYDSFGEVSCTQGSIYVEFSCANGGSGVAYQQGYYDPNTQTTSLNLVLDCSNNNTPCISAFTEVDSFGNTVLEGFATAGAAPYTYEWLIDQNYVGTGQYLDMGNYPAGTYYVCFIVVDANGQICEDCQTITIGNSNNCWTGFTEDSNATGGTSLFAWTQGTSSSYTYAWSVDSVAYTGPVLDISNWQDGTYYVCVTATGTNGDVCEYCEVVVVGNNNTPDCTVYFYDTDTLGFTQLQAYTTNGGSNVSYQYEWTENGNPVGGSSVLDLANYPAGTYSFCVIAYGSDGSVCEYCQTVTVGNQNNPCWVGINYNTDPNGFDYLESVVQGGTAPYAYTWSNGNTGANLDLANLTDGTYDFCVTVTDANGMICTACYTVTIGGDECLDWNVIDLANAPCTDDYNPVCGCDGIEYTNACIAYYCFGVLEWTDGPCNYNGGGVGSGGNTGGNSVDTTCQTTAEFFYYGDINPNGVFDVFFFGFGIDADEFYWDMGEGSTYAGETINHSYSPFDSIQAYTVCLTTLSYTDSCTATVCETIVLDDTPNGFIGGEIVDGDGAGAPDGQVERVMNANGDPLEGITVEIQDPTGAIIASTTTAADGSYSFSGLQFGDYFVHVNIDGVNHSPDLIQLRPYAQRDLDVDYEVVGEQVLSGIDGVSFASGINVAPNPTIGGLVVSLELHNNADVNVIVTDVLGKTVRQQMNSLTQGTHRIELNLEGLSNGIYMVSLQSNGEIFTTKVLKQ